MKKLMYILFLSLILLIQTSFQTIFSLNSYLDTPFDLQKFKIIKGQSHSSIEKKKSYYYKDAEEGIYYKFFMFKETFRLPNNSIISRENHDGVSILTFKPPGPQQNDYLDSNEILIKVYLQRNDLNLPELSFIGQDTTSIKKKLGNNFIRKNNSFVYISKNNLLILKIELRNIKWVKYCKTNLELNSRNMPFELFEQE